MAWFSSPLKRHPYFFAFVLVLVVEIAGGYALLALVIGNESLLEEYTLVGNTASNERIARRSCGHHTLRMPGHCCRPCARECAACASALIRA